MRRPVSIALCVVCAAAFLLVPAGVGAVEWPKGEGVRLSEDTRAVIHPILGVREQFDSNVFLDAVGERKDWITTLTGGFKLEAPLSDNTLRAGYILDYNNFANFYKQSSLNHWANMGMDVPLKDMTWSVDDTYRRVFDRPDTEFTQRLLRNLNNFRVQVVSNENEYSRLGYEIRYDNDLINYVTSGYQYEDRWDNTARGILTYRIAAKTHLLGEFDYGNISYVKKTNSDVNWYQGLAGIRGKLTQKLTGEVKAGWQFRNYTRPSENNFDSVVTMAGLYEEFTERDTLNAQWIRTPYESLYQGTNYYIDNSLELRYRHKFTEKVTGLLGGLYRISQYPEETVEGGTWKKRLDNTWNAGAGVEYAMQKWLTWTLDYKFLQRKSNFGNFDYNDNLVTVSGKAIF